MRYLIFTISLCFGFGMPGNKLVRQKSIKFNYEQKGEYMVYESYDYLIKFNYADFFLGAGTSRYKADYDKCEELVRFYRDLKPVNVCNMNLHGKDSTWFHIEATRKIFDLMCQGKVEIIGKDQHIKKAILYIDKTCPPAAATHWVFKNKKTGNVIFDYYEVSTGCPTF
jgi:hypothetical protein